MDNLFPLDPFAYYRYGATTPITNKQAIHMVAEIGAVYRKDYPRCKESNLKIGIRKIQDTLNDSSITNRQIRRLLRPNTKRRPVVKLPIRSFDIFQAIAAIIDNQADLKKECIATSIRCSRNYNYCRHIMFDKLLSYLNILAEIGLQKSLMDVYNAFNNCERRCR